MTVAAATLCCLGSAGMVPETGFCCGKTNSADREAEVPP